ncbi:uncharacterized protein LOC127637040 [Xyrauchen texanus]|uniref:uncharacterized protein LOC127637040 n=1 Tax=Xyrauchen texanus TaxID=154827 RepID=UPI002241CD1F|nr:uncharacterized protein LOC127637040 [Xyrauchen texanus]
MIARPCFSNGWSQGQRWRREEFPLTVVEQRRAALVLEKLREYHLYLKAEKCSFHQTSLQFLGYIIRGEWGVMSRILLTHLTISLNPLTLIMSPEGNSSTPINSSLQSDSQSAIKDGHLSPERFQPPAPPTDTVLTTPRSKAKKCKSLVAFDGKFLIFIPPKGWNVFRYRYSSPYRSFMMTHSPFHIHHHPKKNKKNTTCLKPFRTLPNDTPSLGELAVVLT